MSAEAEEKKGLCETNYDLNLCLGLTFDSERECNILLNDRKLGLLNTGAVCMWYSLG